MADTPLNSGENEDSIEPPQERNQSSSRLTNIPKGEATPEIIEFIRKRIRESISEIRIGEIRKYPSETIEEHIAFFQRLIEEYKYVSDNYFEYSLAEICTDFITEFYNTLNSYRSVHNLESYYCDDASLTLPGASIPVTGIYRILSVWMGTYEGLSPVEYEITNIEVDEPVINEDKTEREYDAFVTVHSNLKIESDAPRKIIEFYEIKRVIGRGGASNAKVEISAPVEETQKTDDKKKARKSVKKSAELVASVEETEVTRIHALSEANEDFNKVYPSIRISRHIMAVIDARPLYSLPFYDVPKTRFDNWEEKFRPDDWVEELSIEDEESVAVTSIAKSKLTAGSSDNNSVGDESMLEGESAALESQSAVSMV